MLRIECISSKGGRDYNEDTVNYKAKGNDICIVLADGLGGHGGGKIASEVAVNCILTAFLEHSHIDKAWIKERFEEANQAVIQKQTDECQMKTTCVALCIENSSAVWGHLGDSRLYHFVNGQIVSVTMDHSVSQMAVLSGEIKQAEIRFHADRNKVLRAMGADDTVKLSMDECNLNDGNFHAFLLCTDGFWEYVLEGEMEIDLARNENPGEWLLDMEERLKRKVDGHNDNYSAAALFYKS